MFFSASLQWWCSTHQWYAALPRAQIIRVKQRSLLDNVLDVSSVNVTPDPNHNHLCLITEPVLHSHVNHYRIAHDDGGFLRHAFLRSQCLSVIRNRPLWLGFGVTLLGDTSRTLSKRLRRLTRMICARGSAAYHWCVWHHHCRDAEKNMENSYFAFEGLCSNIWHVW